MIRSIIRADHAVARKVAALPPSPVDSTVKALTTAANGGVLWLALASALATRSPATRRGATTGLGALVATGLGIHVAVKPLIRRARPHEPAPASRTLARRPASTSFPSGHAATSAAFCTAVALASPRAGLAIAPLAVGVAYSRVHVGVHWCSDVVVGSVLGALVAGVATRIFSTR